MFASLKRPSRTATPWVLACASAKRAILGFSYRPRTGHERAHHEHFAGVGHAGGDGVPTLRLPALPHVEFVTPHDFSGFKVLALALTAR
jgi:hypothetical protein